ncbi:amidohydrolase family protein [Paraburkholderia sp.]|uniref:amidohydrolase family protein n=1 Tax=Paraburkholderia sp. TaxID=1926495 RepID=UPI003D6EC6F7
MQKTLIRNATIITMDPSLGDLHGDILIDGSVIAALGQELPDAGADVIDGRDSIVVPGFVNAHLHTWQTCMRGIASNWTLPEYLRWIHAGLAEKFSPADIYISTLVGALNQIDCGTTTLVDWCHNNPTPEHTDAAIDALKVAGLRTLFLHGSPKPDPKSGRRPFWETPHPRSEIERLSNVCKMEEGLLSLGMAILGPHYSTIDVAFHDFELAREFGLVASMHQGGGPARSPGGWLSLHAAGLLDDRVNIVHGNDLSDTELELLMDASATFTTTAESEMICGHGHPIIGRLRARGHSPSLGSDIESAVSGDMLTAARMALSHQRSLDNMEAKHAGGVSGKSSIGTREALEWVTTNGARMTRQAARIGSLSVGKQADLVMLSSRALNMQPIHDPVSAVVMHANPSNVDSVMIAGNWKKRHGRLLHEGLPELMETLNEAGKRIISEMGIGMDDIHPASNQATPLSRR